LFKRILATIIFAAIFIWGQLDFAGAAIVSEHLDYFRPILAGTRIQSFYFGIEIIEFEGMPLGTVTTIHKYEKGSSAVFSNGGQLLYTPNGIRVNVTNGRVAMGFETFDGVGLTFAAEAGNSFEFEPESLTISSSSKNTNEVLVLFDGQQFFIPPGERTQIVEIDIMAETKTNHFDQHSERLIPVVIFGSAFLDVSTIEISSLNFEGFAMKREGEGLNLAVIDNIDDDDFPDLIVMFEASSNVMYKHIGYPTLRGNLFDGTIINGKYNITFQSRISNAQHREDVRVLREVR
jgi:hypothetical protein